MRKIEIYIREVDVDDDFKEIEHKRFRTTTVVNKEICDQNLDYLLNEKWKDIRDYYLRNRDAVPFAKIRRDHEPLED